MISAISFTNGNLVEGKKEETLVLETNLRDLMLLSFLINKKMSIEHLVNLGDFAKISLKYYKDFARKVFHKNNHAP